MPSTLKKERGKEECSKNKKRERRVKLLPTAVSEKQLLQTLIAPSTHRKSACKCGIVERIAEKPAET